MNKKISLYEINLQREILREKSAEILADFHRYMEKNNIEFFKETTPIGQLYDNLGYIYRNIFSSDCFKEMKDLYEANGKLDLIKDILKNCSKEVKYE